MKVDYPITQSLDFFDNPYQIIDFSKTLEFHNDPDKHYPGVRSDELWEVNYPLFQSIAHKQLSLFYSQDEMQETTYQAEMSFQKITSEDTENGEGWIHHDGYSQLTTVIYLSPNLQDIGTEIWLPKKEWAYYEWKPGEREYFQGNKNNVEGYIDNWKDRRSKYQKISSHNSIFNSCIYFDGAYPHSANLNIPEGEERLTIVTFFRKIFKPAKGPILRTFQ